MKDLRDRGVGHQGVQRSQVDVRGERVDRRRLLGTGNLNQAQDRPIGALAHKFGVDRDEGRILLPRAKAGESVALGDNRHGLRL